MREMRKSGRVFSRCQAVVKVLKPEHAMRRYDKPRYGHTSDFSASGIRIVLGEELPIGATVELVLVLLDPPATFQHFGLVRWIKQSADERKYFIGLEFQGSSPAVMQMWLKMLAERYPNMISSRRGPQFASDTGAYW